MYTATSEQLASIANFIQKFDARFKVIKDMDLRPMKNLTSLSISNRYVGGYILMLLPKITELKLYGVTLFTDDDLIAISTRLTSLTLEQTTMITGHAVSKLTNLTKLKEYNANRLTDSVVVCLKNLKSIRIMTRPNLSGTCLSQLSSLERLNVSSSYINPEYISQLTGLKKLNVPFNHTIFPQHISGLTNLTDLDIRHSDQLHNMMVYSIPSLRRIHVTHIRYHHYMQLQRKPDLEIHRW
jgi:hypothetical protein